MALTEAQIVRFSRQILLREVGGRGQQRLLDGAVRVVGQGAALDEAVAYLLAGGSPLELPEGFTPGGFLLGAALPTPGVREGDLPTLGLRAAPPAAATLVVLGAGVAFRRADACPACWQLTLDALPAEPEAPGAGALAALAVQRLVLGWSAPHGLARWSGARYEASTPCCPAHQPR